MAVATDTLQKEDFAKLKAYQDSAHVDPQTRRNYFNWLCPTTEEKARLTAQYLQLNPSDTTGVSAMICSISDSDEPEIEPTEKVSEKVYHFDPLLVFLYLKELGADLADIFKKSLLNIRDIINMNKEKKQEDKERTMPIMDPEVYEMQISRVKEKQKTEQKEKLFNSVSKGFNGREKYNAEELGRTVAQEKYKQLIYEEEMMRRYEDRLRERAAQRELKKQEQEMESTMSIG